MIWAIGDIHGCFYTLKKLLHSIEETDRNPQYIFIGDYTDRGNHSKQVIELIIELVSHGHKAIRGNHDDLVDFIINNSCKSDLSYFMYGDISQRNAVRYWLQHGLYQTLISYGFEENQLKNLIQKELYTQIQKNFYNLFPENHRKFINELPLFWENDKNFVVHGFLNSFIEINRFGLSNIIKNKETYTGALWDRPTMLELPYIENLKPKWNKFGIFGHTPTIILKKNDPILTEYLCLLDTGVCFAKTNTDCALSALCLEDKKIIKEITDRRDVE